MGVLDHGYVRTHQWLRAYLIIDTDLVRIRTYTCSRSICTVRTLEYARRYVFRSTNSKRHSASP